MSRADQQYIRSEFDNAQAAIDHWRQIEEAAQRRQRAIDTTGAIDRMRTDGVAHGEVDQRVITDYTTPGTGRAEAFFNRPLRELDMTEQQETAVRGLQQSLLRSPVAREQELWRGTRHFISGVDAPEAGHTYREQGFLSTSRRRNIAEGFGNILIKITAHTSGRDIISLGGDEYGGGEEEVLFPAGSSFRYIRQHEGVYEYQQV